MTVILRWPRTQVGYSRLAQYRGPRRMNGHRKSAVANLRTYHVDLG